MSSTEPLFLDFLQKEQPLLWRQLQAAAKEGLLHIHEPTDSITATNRLLLTYPGLHTVLARIINDWAEKRISYAPYFKQLIHPVTRED